MPVADFTVSRIRHYSRTLAGCVGHLGRTQLSTDQKRDSFIIRYNRILIDHVLDMTLEVPGNWTGNRFSVVQWTLGFIQNRHYTLIISRFAGHLGRALPATVQLRANTPHSYPSHAKPSC